MTSLVSILIAGKTDSASSTALELKKGRQSPVAGYRNLARLREYCEYCGKKCRRTKWGFSGGYNRLAMVTLKSLREALHPHADTTRGRSSFSAR